MSKEPAHRLDPTAALIPSTALSGTPLGPLGVEIERPVVTTAHLVRDGRTLGWVLAAGMRRLGPVAGVEELIHA